MGEGFDVRTTSISASAQNPSVLLVGTATAGVLISRDSGQTWQQVSGIPTTSPVNVIVQDPQRSSFIYVGTKQAFYLSHDGGDHWSRRGGNLPFGDFTSILINPRNTNEVFAGNAYQNGEVGGGVYRSNDAGTTWVRIDAREHRCRACASGRWRWIRTTRTLCLWVRTLRASTSCRAAPKLR